VAEVFSSPLATIPQLLTLPSIFQLDDQARMRS